AFQDGNLTAPFLEITIDPPGFLQGVMGSEPVTLFGGFQLEQIPYLVALCLAFLMLVIINGLFKLQINTQKGRLGERMLPHLRYDLFDSYMRLPQIHIPKVEPEAAAPFIQHQLEPLAGFIGDAFVQPAVLGGHALTAPAFCLVQSVWLRSVAIAILLVQAIL